MVKHNRSGFENPYKAVKKEEVEVIGQCFPGFVYLVDVELDGIKANLIPYEPRLQDMFISGLKRKYKLKTFNKLTIIINRKSTKCSW